MTESIEKNVAPCEDCGTKGTRYEENETEGHYYCWAHAKAHGFCPSCGNVVEGIEREDFFYMPKYGICSNCVEDLKYELGEFDDQDDEDGEYEYDG